MSLWEAIYRILEIFKEIDREKNKQSDEDVSL